MRTLQLGHTGEQVSSLALGCMYFGTRIDEAQSFRLLDQYLDAGGSFLDTANNYAFWVEGFEGGESERLLGRWLSARGNRRDLFIATKAGFNMPPRVPVSLSRQTLMEQCENSLRHLQTDVIDLYYAHTDDRATPLEETLEAFSRLVEQGKVRYIGCSNTLAWRIEQARLLSEHNGWPEYCCVQQRHSYLIPKAGVKKFGNGHVPLTIDLLDYATERADRLTVVAYSALLGGVYAPNGGPIAPHNEPDEYDTSTIPDRLAVLNAVAREVSATANQVVLAWLVQGNPPMIALVSSGSSERLQENLDADGVTLSPEQIDRLNRAAWPGTVRLG